MILPPNDDVLKDGGAWLFAGLGLIAVWLVMQKVMRMGVRKLIARGCLLVTLFAWAVMFLEAVALVAVALPQALIVFAFILFYFRRRVFHGSGWLYGTARLATPQEIADAGHLGKAGLPVGIVKPPRISIGLWKHPDLFLAAMAKTPSLVMLDRWTHAAVFAGAGRGKSTGLIIPYLLTCWDSIVVNDPKGELYKATAAARRAMGQRVVVLDPYFQVTRTPDTLNPR